MTAIKLKGPVLEGLTEEEFYQFCADNRDLGIERDANHQITIMLPTNSETGASNGQLIRLLATGLKILDLAFSSILHRVSRSQLRPCSRPMPVG